MFTRSMLPILALLLTSVAGCSDQQAGKRPTSPVDVVVTHRGKPVESATVTFVATDDSTPAFGITDSQGKATLSTYNSGDGAVIAAHTVGITKMQLDSKTPAGEVADTEDPAYDPTAPPSVAPPNNMLPNKYALPAGSGLTAEVKEGEKNEFRFDLTD